MKQKKKVSVAVWEEEDKNLPYKTCGIGTMFVRPIGINMIPQTNLGLIRQMIARGHTVMISPATVQEKSRLRKTLDRLYLE